MLEWFWETVKYEILLFGHKSMALFGDLEEIIDSLVGGGPAWRQEEEEMCQLALTELTGDGIVWSKKQHNDFLVHKRLYRIF